MKRTLAVILILLVAVVAIVVISRDRPWNADRVYREYDRDFRAYAASAVNLVGKETIRIEPLSNQFTVPQKLTIAGTPYEIGLTIGHIARQAGTQPPIVTEANRTLNQKLAELYLRVYPQQLELVRGVADVYGQAAEDIDLRVFEKDFTTPLWTNLLKLNRFEEATDFAQHGDPLVNHHCSAASYFSNGHHFVGNNFDHASDRPTFFTLLEMTGTYKVMGQTVYELTGEIIDGMNEKGFALCVASNDYDKYQLRQPYPQEPAIVMWHMMQVVLQTCATVDEALELLRTVRVWFPEEGNHWLIADATGKAAIVEWTPGDHQLFVHDQQEPYKLMTNTACQEGEEYLIENCPRYRKAKPLLEKGTRTTDEMFEVMEAMRINRGPGRSLWTSVMDLNARVLDVRYFKEYDRKLQFKF